MDLSLVHDGTVLVSARERDHDVMLTLMGNNDDDVSVQLRLDPDVLWDIGFRDLTRAQVTDVLDDIYSTLQMRVGSRLAEGLDDNQLATFQRLIDRGDESGADKWLRDNKPGYRGVVREEFDHIISALRRSASFLRDNQNARQESPRLGNGGRLRNNEEMA